MSRAPGLCGFVFIFFAALGLPSVTTAQVIEITKDDLLGLNERTTAIQLFVAEGVDSGNADLQAVLGARGADQTYDLRPFSFSLSGEGTIRHMEFSEADAENLPGTDDSDLQDAAYVVALEISVDGAMQGTSYNYSNLTDDGEYLVGDVVLFEDSGTLYETTTVYDPAQQYAALPLSYDDVSPTTWQDETNYTTVMNGVPMGSGTEKIEGEVQGYGTVITPAGTAEVLRVKRTYDETEVDYQFITPERGATVATVETEEDGSYSVTYITESTQTDEVAVGAGETGALVSNNGAAVSFTDGSTSEGSLALFTYDETPQNRSFSGTATSDDGTSVTPDALWTGRYYVVDETDLDGFTAEVCLDTDNVPNVADAGKLVVLTREAASEEWTPLDTSIKGTSICATVSSFSQFAVGGSSADGNTLPVELIAFEVATDDEAVHLTWQTASETNNAGFEVERNLDGQWQMLAFVEGARTTTEAQSYYFADEALPLTAGRVEYRLKQVDIDGTAHYSDVVTVARNAVDRVGLEAPYPNPARSAATVHVAVPEAADAAQLTVYNMLGQRVRQVDLAGAGRHALRLDVGSLPSGMYFMRLEADGAVRTEQLTIVR